MTALFSQPGQRLSQSQAMPSDTQRTALADNSSLLFKTHVIPRLAVRHPDTESEGNLPVLPWFSHQRQALPLFYVSGHWHQPASADTLTMTSRYT